MTVKRFTCDNDYYKGLILKDNLTNEILETEGIVGYYTACNKLNELYNENEQLKEILHFSRNDNAEDILNVLNTQQNEIVRLIKENEQLKQFKQNVLGLIDKNLEKDKHYYEMSYEDYLNGRIEVLEELKKELEE